MERNRISDAIYDQRKTNRFNIHKPISGLLLEICRKSDEKSVPQNPDFLSFR